MTSRDVHYIDPDPRKSRLTGEMLAMSLSTAKKNITTRGPSRMLEGIAVSGPERIGGTSLIAAGFKFVEEVPLVWSHESDHVLGIVRNASARAGVVTFAAEMMNGPDVPRYFPHVNSVWEQIQRGERPRVSVSFRGITVSAEDSSVITSWSLAELSLCNLGLDPNARVTACFERANVIYSDDRPQRRYFWRESGVAA